MKYLFVFAWLLPQVVFSQDIRVREIKLRPFGQFYDSKDSTIIYPVIVTKNEAASRLINKEIKRRILDSDDEGNAKISAGKALLKMAQTGLSDLTYTITYNRNGILSLNIYQMVEVAYPHSSYDYFNFDSRTGKVLKIEDILKRAMIEQFRSMVYADKLDSLKRYKEDELKSHLMSKDIDSTVYQSALDIINEDCIGTASLDDFSISLTGIEIFDQCEFPHFLTHLQPGYKLKYSYRLMEPYVRAEYRGRLSYK